MNTRNINSAGKFETIRTTVEKLKEASVRSTRAYESRNRDDAFRSHIKSFANTNVCYTAVNGIVISVPTR